MKRAEELEARKEEKHLTSKYSINNLISSVYAGDLEGEDPTDTLRSTSVKPTVLPKVYPHIFFMDIREKLSPAKFLDFMNDDNCSKNNVWITMKFTQKFA